MCEEGNGIYYKISRTMSRDLPRALRARWPWLALGLALRAAFALKLGDRLYQIDESGFLAAARQLAATGVLGVDGRAGAAPLVPAAFFGFFLRFFGPRLLWPRLGQALVGVLTALALGEMTRRLTRSELAGRLALAIACVYPYFIYYGGMLLSETLAIALLVPGLWWLCEALSRREGGAPWAAAGGLALALSALARTEAAFIVAVIWAVAALACAAGRWSWKAWAAGVALWALPLLGMCLRNQARLGAFTLDTHGGISMLQGTEFFELNNVDTGVAMAEIEKQPFYAEAQKLPDAARDGVYFAESLRWMRAHPGKTAYYALWKLGKFWRPVPRLDKTYTENGVSHPSAGAPRWALWLMSAAWEPWLIVLGFWGLWLLRARMDELYPLFLFIAGTVGIHVITVSQPRYRLPVMPLLILGSALALARLSRRNDTG